MAPSVLDDLLEGCQIIDPQWRYLYLNHAAATHGRRTPEELLGRTMMEVYPGIERTTLFEVLSQSMADRCSRLMENEFVFPDGLRGWFELRIEPVPEGLFVLSLDVSDRKRAEQRILHLNAVLRGIRDVNQLITRERDRDRLIHSACQVLVAARGFRAVTIRLIDRPGGHLVAQAEVRGEAEGPGAGTVEVPLAHAGEVYGVLIASLEAGASADPEERGLLEEVAGDLAFALRGIEVEAGRGQARAELHRAEEQLRQAQKLEAIGQLAGGIAHDFNNLLMVQIGYCDLIEDELGEGSAIASDLSQIKACAKRAAELTRQLLAFSRKQTLMPQPLDLAGVVRGMEKMLRRLIGENVELVIELAGDLGAVKADPGQMEQVIMNLAVNARDAMPRGGRLTLRTAAAGPHVILSVSDTGCGMDEATLSRLFEPFFTTKALGKGTGLGLATVYGIVKQSGGEILVTSEPGHGSTFQIELPRIDAEPSPVAPDTASAARGNGERVLVVEDEPALRELLVRMVEGLGYRVRAAAGSAEAHAVLQREGWRPELLVTDVVLPGIDGKSLADALGRIRPGLKVLYMSGYADDTIVHHGVLEPGTVFLQKPFHAEDLARKLRAALGAG